MQVSYIGYIYWRKGYEDKSESFFNELISYQHDRIESDPEIPYNYYAHYSLAGIYAFKGQKEKAYKHLNTWHQEQKVCMSEILRIRYNPLFDNIRHEPEFQKIDKEIEVKFQAEHERVKQWLEENDML
jgi:hypothetical protein